MALPTVIERLRVALAQQDIVLKSQELARHMQETQNLEQVAANERKLQAEALKARRAREHEMAADIALGSEERDVECFEEPRFSERLVDIVRRDTREVVRTRAMQPDERQKSFFDGDLDDDDGERTLARQQQKH